MIKVKGKYLFGNDKKFYIKGVAYGNFDPADTQTGTFFFDKEKTWRDFKLIKAANINTIRFYEKPPDYVMEAAKKLGLKVILTLYINYLDKNFGFKNKKFLNYYKGLTENLVSFGKKYGNVILYLLGTEIPELLIQQKGISILDKFIQKYGRKNFENFIYELHKIAKITDLNCLTSYSNFPPTEFLDLSFLDIITFDVYLHSEKDLKAYLARLQTNTGDKPLLIGEIGADALAAGEEFQANLLEWSLPAIQDAGCCGSVIYTFADGWWSGEKVAGWQMGIVSEDRKPKRAYAAVKRFFNKVQFPDNLPKISVIVAGYNEEKYIAECLEALLKSNYPKDKTEIIVVSDGSQDKTTEIAQKYPVKVLTLKENRGLSFARNVGAETASGEIIAYTDADCRADIDWLYHIARSFDDEKVSCVGGPNITPPEDSLVAKCTALAPGCPTHVLIDDTRADHVPGCNMAYRKSALKAVGGFNEIFRIAGDDVDIEWKLQKAGHLIKFNPAAQVLHHRRNSIKSYIKQQFNYGISEAMVRQAHPERFQGFDAKWQGRIYNTHSDLLTLFKNPIIYYDWFPKIYNPLPNYWMKKPLDISWHILWIFLLLLTPVSWIFTIAGLIMIALTVAHCLMFGKLAVKKRQISKVDAFKKFFLISFLTFIWAPARKYGQFRGWLLTRDGRQ